MDVQKNRSLESRLLQIQDEIRSSFGWSLESDVEVAEWLVNEITNKGHSNWSLDGFHSNWRDVKSQLLGQQRNICIVGAAVEKYEVEMAINKQHS